MNLRKELVLENELVLLRPLKKDDFTALLPFSLQEPELWDYSLQPASGEENLKSYMDSAIKGRKAGHSYPFLVLDKRTNEAAGSTRFYDIQTHHNTTQLGFTWYGKKFQRTGLNRHCKFLLLDYAFKTVGFERVEFRADHTNERSIAAMKAIGCTPEGILRSNCKGGQGRRSSIVLSILKSEWEDKLRADLLSKIR